jgi:TonB family protein
MTNFQPRTGAKVYGSEGAALLLANKIGEGGEGSVWSVENNTQVVAKFYKNGLPPGQTRKLDVMCRLKSDSLLKVAAWPTAMLKSSPSAQVEGLLMRRIIGYEAAHLLYSPKSRRTSFPEAQFPFILHTTANIARSFAAVHEAGQVIGDVNHGNLLVAKNATVALIDCDSFQITEGPTTFPCLVGVPEYTPPELQGHSFREIRRTQQHDAFGLAVLTFHMLFLGRDPFAGIPSNGTSDVSIPDAIREYRFAYLPDHGATHMEPPPSAPRLSDFTPAISELFIRAFTRDGLNGRRPSAHDWIAALETLSKSIKQCAANSSHHFYRNLQFCPWCRVEAIVGVPTFGIKIIVVRDEHFNIAAVWAQIEAIHPALDTQPLPTGKEFLDSCSVDIRIEAVLKRRHAKRVISVAVILLAVIVVAAGQLPAVLSIVVLMCGLYGMKRLWASSNVISREFKAAYDTALDNYNAATQEWAKTNQAPAPFLEKKKALETAKQEFNDLPALRARKIAELNGKRWPKQLQYFLERHRIEDSHIPGIGEGRKTLLRSYNVEDAYDVEYHKLENVKGFGPAMRAVLLDWRKGLEREFQFDPNQPVDAIDLQRLEQEFNHKKADLIRSLTSGPQELQRSLLLWQVQRSQIRTKLQDSAQHLAQAQVNMNALSVSFAGRPAPVAASVPAPNVAAPAAGSIPVPTLLSLPSHFKSDWWRAAVISAFIILVAVLASRALKQASSAKQDAQVSELRNQLEMSKKSAGVSMELAGRGQKNPDKNSQRIAGPRLVTPKHSRPIRPAIIKRTGTRTPDAPPDIPAIYSDPLARTLPFSRGPSTSEFAGTVYRAGGNVSMPQLVSKVEPEYSEEARKANLSGTVLLSIIIDEHGLPRDIRVTRAVGLGLDEKAIEAVSHWRFRPGTKALRPVAVQANVEVNFRMCCK